MPTALLEGLPGIPSGTELRVILAVICHTWGWTTKSPDPKTGKPRIEHDRWTRLSHGRLAGKTGRSASAVKRAVQTLQGRWIERTRPGSGAYQYRFLPEAIGDGSGDRSSFSGDVANEYPPDRQRNTPRSFKRESSLDNQAQGPSTNTRRSPPASSTDRGNAVPRDLSPEKQAVAQKLGNVGVWPGRIAEVVERFSVGRIEANFQLFRQRMQEQEIRKPAAWLYQAITQGFAGYTAAHASSDAHDRPGATSDEEGALPPLSDRSRVSEAVKSAYVQRGTPESAFHLCKPGSANPYMYFDPEGEGPSRRI
jgi:hypothetical protein